MNKIESDDTLPQAEKLTRSHAVKEKLRAFTKGVMKIADTINQAYIHLFESHEEGMMKMMDIENQEAKVAKTALNQVTSHLNGSSQSSNVNNGD